MYCARENWLFLLFFFYFCGNGNHHKSLNISIFVARITNTLPYLTHIRFINIGRVPVAEISKRERKRVSYSLSILETQKYTGAITLRCAFEIICDICLSVRFEGERCFLDPYLYISITPSNSHQTGIKRYRIPLMDLKVERRIEIQNSYLF